MSIEVTKRLLPNYKIKVNGNYFVGFDDSNTVGKTSHGGWSRQATEMDAIVFTKELENGKLIEGNISLKSTFNSIYDRMRYGGLDVDSLEIVRVK